MTTRQINMDEALDLLDNFLAGAPMPEEDLAVVIDGFSERIVPSPLPEELIAAGQRISLAAVGALESCPACGEELPYPGSHGGACAVIAPARRMTAADVRADKELREFLRTVPLNYLLDEMELRQQETDEAEEWPE